MEIKLLNKLKNRQGVAGLDVFLAVITMLFAIGLVVMIFILMGQNLENNANIRTSTTVNFTNITMPSVVNDTGTNITGTAGLIGCAPTFDTVYNDTTDDEVRINAGNYSTRGCEITYIAPTNVDGFNNSIWNISGSYSHLAENEATQTINATTAALGTATDFFGVIILITSMIVLVLLTVIIIRALRSGGLTGGEGA